jgi:hypothetical protein
VLLLTGLTMLFVRFRCPAAPDYCEYRCGISGRNRGLLVRATQFCMKRSVMLFPRSFLGMNAALQNLLATRLNR